MALCPTLVWTAKESTQDILPEKKRETMVTWWLYICFVTFWRNICRWTLQRMIFSILQKMVSFYGTPMPFCHFPLTFSLGPKSTIH